jgi:hypothetical protein
MLGREAALIEAPLVADAPFYFPLTDKGYEIKPGFARLGSEMGNGAVDGQLFQIDSAFAQWRRVKEHARGERLGKYWCRRDLAPAVEAGIARFFMEQLLREHPALFRLEESGQGRALHCGLTREVLHFDSAMALIEVEGSSAGPPYDGALDALACQVQEDWAITCRRDGREWVAAVHLCSANHWAAEEKIGQDFVAVHAPVAGMEALSARAAVFVQAMIEKGPFVRFAWGLSTDRRLNHHPQPPTGMDAAAWHGRNFNAGRPALYMRVERQVLWPFPQLDASFFAIRPYFYDCAELDLEQRNLLADALEGMSTATLEYKGLAEGQSAMCAWLRGE